MGTERLKIAESGIVLGDMYEPTGDNQADIKNIKQWYSQYKGKFPEQF